MSIGNGCCVVVPLKGFAAGKSRLKTAIGDRERSELIEILATQVIHAALDMPVYVASSDPVVLEWADRQGTFPVPAPVGLNAALSFTRDHLRQLGWTRLIIAAGDLPLARGLGRFDCDGVAIAPDRKGAGTNVLALPAAATFRFRFGRHSYRRHVAESVRRRLVVRTIPDDRLALDIDEAADLEQLRAVDPRFDRRNGEPFGPLRAGGVHT